MAALKALSRGEGAAGSAGSSNLCAEGGALFCVGSTYDVCNLDYEPTGSEGSGGEFLILPRMRR